MCWRHSKFSIIEPDAIGLRAVANTILRWIRIWGDTKDPATHETRGIAKTEGISIVKPNTAQSRFANQRWDRSPVRETI